MAAQPEEMALDQQNHDRPNILFIMADQMAAPLLSMYNSESPIKTPNLDRLAKESVVFDSAYCNSPLCAPSRFCLVSGQLPSKIGAYDNASDLPADTPTAAHYVRIQGYHTCLAGKMHFCGPDQLHGYEQRLTSDIYPGDYGWSVNWDEPAVRPDWYHNMSSVLDSGPIVRTNQLDFDDEVLYKSKQYLYEHCRQREDQPFFLTVSFTHPHDPYNMTKEYWDMYEDVEIPMPKTPAFPQAMQDPHAKRLLRVMDLAGKDMPVDKIRDARRSYFAACTYVDAKIGELMQTLRHTGLDENTIIVFSGDHGDMLGERGLWYKMNWFEMAGRVPLFVHSPSRFSPRHVPENVSTMDLMPTFVEMAGSQIDPYLPVDGLSLLPYITNSDQPKPDTVIGEYMGEGTLAPLVMIRRGRYKFVYCPIDPPQLYDLIEDPLERNNLAAGYAPDVEGPITEKFDPSSYFQERLPADIRPHPYSQSDPLLPPSRALAPSPPRTPSPYRNDAIPHASGQKACVSDPRKVLTEFFREVAARWNFPKIEQDVLHSQRRRRLVNSALTKGEITTWDYSPQVNGAALYVRNVGKRGEALEDLETRSRWPRSKK
ncbi:MAG: hypothetical protein Q9227_007295 [Pyrenula ochraceoflavens]